MAKLNDNVAAAIELAIYQLPSFGDTFVENTDEGLKITIADGNLKIHEALSEYLAYEHFDVDPKEDHILVVEKRSSGDGYLDNKKLNDIYQYIITQKDKELLRDFDRLIMPFIGGSHDKLEVKDKDTMLIIQDGIDTILSAYNVAHDNFVIGELVAESTVMEVMPNVEIGDTIEITTEQDLKDNFGKYIDKLGNINDIAMWLNNNGHMEIEITDTMADTINGLNVDVRLSDGSSKLPNESALKTAIGKFFTDEDMKKHLGNKKLFESFGFEMPNEAYLKSEPTMASIVSAEGIAEGEMVARAFENSLIYSPARQLVKVYPDDGEAYVVEPVINENDANRVLIAVNDSDNDSSVLIDKLTDMEMIMVMESAMNEEFTKDEFKSIIDVHNVSGTEISSDDISDKLVKKFNTSIKKFLEKYPDFEIFKNDYDGEEDDEFVNMLMGVLKTGGLEII